MIRDITITAKGDYQRITFSREEDSNTIEMSFSYPHGCSYASFSFKDMKWTLMILIFMQRLICAKSASKKFVNMCLIFADAESRCRYERIYR